MATLENLVIGVWVVTVEWGSLGVGKVGGEVGVGIAGDVQEVGAREVGAEVREGESQVGRAEEEREETANVGEMEVREGEGWEAAEGEVMEVGAEVGAEEGEKAAQVGLGLGAGKVGMAGREGGTVAMGAWGVHACQGAGVEAGVEAECIGRAVVGAVLCRRVEATAAGRASGGWSPTHNTCLATCCKQMQVLPGD